jgi:hypothetical protein
MKLQSGKPAPNPQAMASTKGEIRRLNVNTKATAAELKEFLAELKSRSPQEMLGIVAASQLFRALALSSVLVGVGIIALTAIPFFLGGNEKAEQTQAEAPAPAAPPVAPPASTTPAAEPAPSPPSAADLSELGVSEEKMAPPNENPLENKKDDFLKGLD